MTKSSPHIAVVEDDSQMRTLLRDFLTTQGYSVSCYGTGMEALNAFPDHPADAVISDIAMPGMTGVELLKRVKSETPSLPCILITAFATSEGEAEARKAGAAGYLTKPFKLGVLAAALREQLQKK